MDKPIRRMFVLLFVLTACACGPNPDPAAVTDQHGRSIIPIKEPEALDTLRPEQKKPVRLLGGDGGLAACGWSRHSLFIYERGLIRADRKRLKEWEHYTFYNNDIAGAITVSDIGTLGFGSMELIDLKKGRVIVSRMEIVRPGVIAFPENVRDDVLVERGKTRVSLEKTTGRRHARFLFHDRNPKECIRGDIVFSEMSPEALAIVTPFAGKDRFFYEYKMPSLTATGYLEYAGKRYDLSGVKTYAVLDWGRGVWPEDNQWLWASGAGLIGRDLLSFNLGYGFGTGACATENGLIYRGKVHKLGRVIWRYDVKNYMAAWRFASDNGRFSMAFTPVFLLHSDITLKEMIGFLGQLYGLFSLGEIRELLATKAYLNKAFGYYSGHVVLDDGTRLRIDRFAGFAEQMYQQW